MENYWKSIISLLEENSEYVIDSINPPASEIEIKDVEDKLNVFLPEEFKQFYMVHNGQNNNISGITKQGTILSLKEILSQWQMWQNLVASGAFDKIYSKPDSNCIKNDWYNLKWIPITYDGHGNHLCIDLDPAEDGRVGQIISFEHDSPERKIVSFSFTEWICSLIENLEDEKFNTIEGQSRKKENKSIMSSLAVVTPFETNIEQTEFGTVLTLVSENGISPYDSISCNNKCLLANYVYDNKGSYKIFYTLIDTDGSNETFIENGHGGYFPSLFLSPNEDTYVSFTPYDPNVSLEISIPVFNRENHDLPKGNRDFGGNFIGTTERHSIVYGVDMMLAIEFKNGQIKKKRRIKIPAPGSNKICISENEIHLLAKEGNHLLHRQIDENGNEKKRREINVNPENFEHILNLSFYTDSYILMHEAGKIMIGKIEPNGNCTCTDLIDLGVVYFEMSRPVQISEDTFIATFECEFDNNGWITIKKGRLIELFFSKDVRGYKNILTDDVFPIDVFNTLITSVSKTSENSYAIICYKDGSERGKPKSLIILNRALN